MTLLDRNIDALFYARKKLEFIFNILEGYEFGVGGGSVLKHVYYYIHREEMKQDSIEDLSSMPDIDIFPESHEEGRQIADKFQNEGFQFLGEHPVSTNRKYFYNGNRIDLVCPEAYLGNPAKIIKFFDMTQCAFMVTNNLGYHLEDAFECVEKKRLLLNFVNNQFFSFKRVGKYMNRGFEMSPQDEMFLKKALYDGKHYFYTREQYGSPTGEPVGIFPNGEKEAIVEEFDAELISELREKRCEFTRDCGIIG